MRRRCSASLFVILSAGSCVLVPLRAGAQQEVQVAATAFAEGQQAQLRGDFARAAELFEIADQSSPNAAALRSAIRMRAAAGRDVRAATLALQALQRYPDDADSRVVAEETLDRLGPRLSRILLRCSAPCTATVDGALVGAGPLVSLEFFVLPGSHVIRGAWPGREPVSKVVESRTGQTLEVELQAPGDPSAVALPEEKPKAAEAPAPVEVARVPPPQASPAEANGGGLSPAFFWIGMTLTAAAGAATWWSGNETLSARDDYEENPTREGYEAGVDLERRTNLFIGGTALLGVTTLGIGLFATDWGNSTRVGVRVTPHQAALSIGGSLP